jgi:photoactive yellow protein
MTTLSLPRFNQPALATAIEALPLPVLDTLPFGVIRLNRDGIVEVYNQTERRLSGSGRAPRLGLDFFTGVAPCMNQAGFRGRIEQALKRGQFDLEFAWTGDFGDRLRSLTIRAQPATGGGCWIFISRDDG